MAESIHRDRNRRRAEYFGLAQPTDAEELAEESVTDLRKRATELDIAGRSSMNKDELVAAIAEAEAEIEEEED